MRDARSEGGCAPSEVGRGEHNAAMTREEGLPLDPACDRCGAPLVDARLGVVRDGQNYCCANCSAAGVNAEPLPEA